MHEDSREGLLARIADLQARLEEAEETLHAIRHGEVDALVVRGESGDQIYTLKGADHPYRVLVQEMHEATVTLDESGTILYANNQLSKMLGMDSQPVAGSTVDQFIAPEYRQAFRSLREQGAAEAARGEFA